MFGHGEEDVDMFGWYTVKGKSVFYWTAACKNVLIDCYVSTWSKWGTCNQGTQARTRTIRLAPNDGGKRCPPLSDTRNCIQGANAVQGADGTFSENENQGPGMLFGLPIAAGIVVIVIVVLVSILAIAVVALLLRRKNHVKTVEKP